MIPLPRKDYGEPDASYLRRLVAELDSRLRDMQDQQGRLVSRLFPVGAVYISEDGTLPPMLSALGGWSDPVATGAPINAYALKRTS